MTLPDASEPFPGQVLANDWVASVAPRVISAESFSVYFRGDENWDHPIQPLLESLADREEAPGQVLLWDSAWEPGDPRNAQLKKRIKAAVQMISVEKTHERITASRREK